MILNGAESFFLQGGTHGVLLVHGFTGSPSEMVLFGDYLHKKGYTVLCMRLAGHGTTPEDMARMNWHDWFYSVCDGYALLAGCCQRISVAGLSMGAWLSVLLSQQAEVYKVVSLAAPVYLADEKNLQLLPPREQSTGKFAPKFRKLLPGVPGLCTVSYRKMPLASIHELLDFIDFAKARLPLVRRPILVVQSRKDHTVKPQSAAYIYERAGSACKEIFWLEESGHLLTLDCEREAVFARVADFLEN